MTDLVQFSNSLIKQLVHTKSISVGNPTVIAVCCQLSAVSQGNCILLKSWGSLQVLETLGLSGKTQKYEAFPEKLSFLLPKSLNFLRERLKGLSISFPLMGESYKYCIEMRVSTSFQVSPLLFSPLHASSLLGYVVLRNGPSIPCSFNIYCLISWV